MVFEKDCFKILQTKYLLQIYFLVTTMIVSGSELKSLSLSVGLDIKLCVLIDTGICLNTFKITKQGLTCFA